MKRVKHLFGHFASFGNLLLAYKKARKGSRKSREALHYGFHLEKNIIDLRERLLAGKWQPQPYRFFEIYDPKQRTISVAAFEDRVVHHALVNVLEPIYERSFIFDSYATRKGKGTHAAVLRAQQMLRKTGWFFKSDVEKYFDNIDHNILLGLIERKIGDPALLAVIGSIIQNGGNQGLGLPIGNLTSQFFANVYLDPFDKFVKEKLRIRHYLRYMDDFVLFHEDKDILKIARSLLEEWLWDHLRLRLKHKATYFNSAQNGLSFLGTRIFPGIIRLRPENTRRMFRRLQHLEKQFLEGDISDERLLAGANSYLALLSKYPSAGLRKKMLALDLPA